MNAQFGLDFDGIEDKATIAHHNDFNFGSGDFTIELKVRSIPDLKNKLTLLSKRNAINNGFHLNLNTINTKGEFEVRLGNKTHSFKQTNLKDGLCHFLAIRRQSGQIRLYIDNIASNKGNNSNDISTLVDLLIGQDGISSTAGGDNHLNGQIEELRIWNFARNDIDIFASTSTCLLGNETGLVSYWNMEEGNGQVLHDETGHHNATLGTDYTSEAFDPLWISASCIASCGSVTANFQSDKNPIYSGQHVSFTNTSTGASQYEWRIDNSNVLSTETDIMAYMTQGTHRVELRAFDPISGQYAYHSEVYFVSEYLGVPNTPQANNINHCSMNHAGGFLIEGCADLPLEPSGPTTSSTTSACAGYSPTNSVNGTAALNFKPTSIVTAGGFRLIFQDLETCTGLGFDDPTPINTNSPCASSATYPATTMGEARINTAKAVFEYISSASLLNITSTSPFAIHAGQTASLSTPTIEIYFEASTSNQSYLAGAKPFFHPTSQGGFQGGYIQEIFTTFGTGLPGNINGILDPSPTRADASVIVDFGNKLLNGTSYELSSCHLTSPCNTPNSSSSNQFDLYSILLHEALHAMGFVSVISNTWPSPTSSLISNDFTLYDKMLLDSRVSSPIGNHIIDNTLATYIGNPGDVLSEDIGYYNYNLLGTQLSNYNANTNTQVAPVYSPPIWESGSSLSHFQNSAGDNCNIKNYVMNPGLSPCVERRELTSPEMEVLADLGYVPFPGNYPIGNTDFASTTLGTPICIPVLNNDANPTSLSICGTGTTGITPIVGGTIFSIITNSTGLQEICFTPDPNFVGTAHFQYCISNATSDESCPINVFVEVTSDYCPDDPCNYICNGGFELGMDPCSPLFPWWQNIFGPNRHFSHPNASPFQSALQSTVGWFSSNQGSPDLGIRGSSFNCTGFFSTSFPVGQASFPNTHPGSVGAAPNNRYAQALCTSNTHEGLFTKLVKPLTPGQLYELSFWIRTRGANTPKLNLLIHIHDDIGETATIGYPPNYNSTIGLAYFALASPPFDVIENSTSISSNITPGLNHNHEYGGVFDEWELVTMQFFAPPLNPPFNNNQYLVIEPRPNPTYLAQRYNFFDDFRLEEVNSVPIYVNTNVSYSPTTNTATYTVDVCNNSTTATAATNVSIEHFLPPGLTLNIANSPGWTTTGTPQYTIPTLAASPPVPPLSNCVQLTLVADVPPATPINTDLAACSFATSTNGGDDCVAIANGDNCATFQIEGTDIAIFKSADVSTANAGDPIVFTITVTNKGPHDAHNIDITDLLTNLTLNGISFAPSSILGVNYNQSSGLLEIPTLLANEQLIITLNTTVSPSFSSGQIVNCASWVEMDEEEIFITNNTSCTTVDIVLAGCPPIPNLKIIPPHITTFKDAVLLGYLLPAAQAVNTPQQVLVQSILTLNDNGTGGFDYWFASGSEILMAPDAGFVIPSEGLLTLVGTHVHGCNAMWRSILVQGEGMINIYKNSLIEDAQYAIHAEDKSIIFLEQSTFNNNYVSIYANGLGNPISFNHRIEGVTFEGNSSTFLPGYSGQLPVPDTWPFAGIELHDVLSFNFIKVNPSIFHDLANGIVLFNTNTYIYRTTEIYDMHTVNSYVHPSSGTFLSNIGVYAESTSSATSFKFQGFGNQATDRRSIRNSLVGILVTGRVSFDIQQNNMENFDFVGIAATGTTGQTGTVNNNRIIINAGLSNAITMWQNDPMASLRIENNDISLDGGSFFAPNGITVDDFGTPYPLTISNNQIKMRAARTGILMRNQLGAAQISHNDIDLLNVSPGSFTGFPFRRGIISNGSNGQTITCNIIEGDNSANAYDIPFFNYDDGIYGIHAGMSSSMTYSCNQFNFIPNGIRIDGNNSFNSTIEGSRFGEVARGIWLTGGAQISPQSHNGNRFIWRGPANISSYPPAVLDAWNIGVRNDNGANYAPSLFRNDYSFNPDFRPFWVHSQTDPNWFVNSPSGFAFDCNHPTLVCGLGNPVPLIVQPPNLSVVEQSVVAGTLISPVFPQTAEFESNTLTYDKLKGNPSLTPTGSPEAAFVTNLDQQCEGHFHAIGEQCEALNDLPTTTQTQIQNLEQVINTALDDIYLLDSLWIVDSLNRDSIRTLKHQKAQQILPLIGQLKQIRNSIQLSRVTDATIINNNNNIIVTSKLVEDNLKIVNDIYLKTIAKRIYQFTPQQEQSLDEIARQCPLEGGVAVYKARAMVTFFTHVDYERLQNCERSQSPLPRIHNGENEDVTEGTLIKLYPNPATNQITLKWQIEDARNGKLLIYNSLGQLIQQEPLSGHIGQQLIHLSNYSPGIYICKIHFDDIEVHQEKLIIVK